MHVVHRRIRWLSRRIPLVINIFVSHRTSQPSFAERTFRYVFDSKPPHKNAPRRAKVRRDQRRASRSARSFELDDGENLVWVMSQKQIERRREVAAALAVAAMQYDVKRAMTLLHREPKVPPATPSTEPFLA